MFSADSTIYRIAGNFREFRGNEFYPRIFVRGERVGGGHVRKVEVRVLLHVCV